MAKDYAKSFYKSKGWLKSRRGYIHSVGGICERCKSKGKFIPGKIVHHKNYISEDNIYDVSVTLNWDNLEYLCQDCHNLEHHSNSLIEDGLLFDEEGNLIEC